MTDAPDPADTPDENLAPTIPGNDAQTDPTLITTPPLPNDVVDTPSTVNSVPVDAQAPAESSVGGNLNPEATVTPGFVNGSQVSPADLTNEVNQTDPAALETQEIELFIVHDEAEDGTRVLEVQRPTTYFELADAAEVTISAFELANRNGVHNSVYDIPAGAKIIVPAPQLPVPVDPPAVDLETATAQNVATQNTIGSIQAQAVDAQAMIDPGFAAAAAGVAPIEIPGGLAPSTAAVPGSVGEVIEAPAGATIETGVAADGNAEATIVAPAITDSAPDVITTPDHPTPAAVDPVADALSTPDHPSVAAIEPQAQVSVPLESEPAPTGSPVDAPAPVEAAPATVADDGSV